MKRKTVLILDVSELEEITGLNGEYWGESFAQEFQRGYHFISFCDVWEAHDCQSCEYTDAEFAEIQIGMWELMRFMNYHGVTEILFDYDW